MVTLITTGLLVGIVAGFLLERHLMRLDVREERREWARERGQLLNRIKPESAQAPLDGPDLETFQAPVSDEEWWEASKT